MIFHFFTYIKIKTNLKKPLATWSLGPKEAFLHSVIRMLILCVLGDTNLGFFFVWVLERQFLYIVFYSTIIFVYIYTPFSREHPKATQPPINWDLYDCLNSLDKLT